MMLVWNIPILSIRKYYIKIYQVLFELDFPHVYLDSLFDLSEYVTLWHLYIFLKIIESSFSKIFFK